jgi:endonuclease IV
MKEDIYKMLVAKAESQKQEAIVTIKLLTLHPAGIGDHSTNDFYNNAEEALNKLVDAEDKLEVLEKYKEILF